MSAPFNLNEAIMNWRDALTQSPALQGEALKELESHLREGTSDLQRRGLSEEEAFLIATRRLGRGDALGLEFGKANPAALWRDRALWMLAGMLFLTIGWDLIEAVAWALMYVGSTLNANGPALGWLNVAGSFTMLGLISAAFWRLANGRLERTRRSTGRINRHPVLFTLGALGAVALLKSLVIAFHMLSFRNLPVTSMAQAVMVTYWFTYTGPMIVAGLIIILFVRLWRWRTMLLSTHRF